MYGGNTDQWEIPIYGSDGTQMAYGEAQYYTFTLSIKDYAYSHRPDGMTQFSLIKSGTVSRDDNGNAFVVFTFAPEDTMFVYGKFLYQITSIGSIEENRNSAQGELLIMKTLDTGFEEGGNDHVEVK